MRGNGKAGTGDDSTGGRVSRRDTEGDHGESGKKPRQRRRKEAEAQTVTIAAAASLETCLRDELIPLFEEQNPGFTVVGTYDSSGKLQTQIEEGAGIDVFFQRRRSRWMR